MFEATICNRLCLATVSTQETACYEQTSASYKVTFDVSNGRRHPHPHLTRHTSLAIHVRLSPRRAATSHPKQAIRYLHPYSYTDIPPRSPVHDHSARAQSPDRNFCKRSRDSERQCRWKSASNAEPRRRSRELPKFRRFPSWP